MKIFNLMKSVSVWKLADKKLIAAYSLGVSVVLFIFFFLVSTAVIGQGVNRWCDTATNLYDGDCIEALVQFIDDENNDPRDRSGAVWALGQLGDERALPTLRKLYDDSDCEHDMNVCQYELGKAINLIDGGVNLTASFWRWTVH